MAFLQRFGIGKHDTETEALQAEVDELESELAACEEVAEHSFLLRKSLAVVLGLAIFVAGFGLGVYRDSITDGAVNIAARFGLAEPRGGADAAYLAYERGRDRKALGLAQPLAERGDARAETLLGLLYYGGRGVPRDYNKALMWFRRAAEGGSAAAKFQIGYMYFEGNGVPQNYVEAAQWYQKAAEQGDPNAQYHLGFMYARGDGVPRDNVKAHMWFNLAAGNFNAAEVKKRRQAINGRDVTANRMTPTQVAEAQQLAREWRPKNHN